MPDAGAFSIIRQQMSAMLRNAGMTATLRTFVSGSANQAEFGLATAHTYQQRVITALFKPVPIMEMQQAGGQYMVGDMWMTTVRPHGIQDEINYMGARWQLVSTPIVAPLFGTALYQSVIRRA